MIFKTKWKVTVFLFLIFISFNLQAQNLPETDLFDSNKTINYYGLISSDLDTNMSKMTSDLYYTQLCEIQNLIINDLRSDISINTDQFSKENINIYFKVNKIENSTKWNLSLFLQNNRNGAFFSESKEYDSFYKILMEPKSSLQETLKKLIYQNIDSHKLSDEKTQNSFPDFTEKSNLSTEEFSGTWMGENYVDKIVILRGGRGFVIFNNGATMNISIQLKNSGSINSLVITQTSRTNASFYPNIDRKLALTSANTAKPIEWTFQIIDSNTLSGIKKTLIQNNEGTSVTEGEEKVIWNRKS